MKDLETEIILLIVRIVIMIIALFVNAALVYFIWPYMVSDLGLPEITYGNSLQICALFYILTCCWPNFDN